VLVALATLALATAPGTSAAIPFCLPGSAAGQCENPQGIAVDSALERVYVVDRGANRVSVFDTEGIFQFSFGGAGAGGGQFAGPSRIAVDDDPASPAHHAIYVGADNFRVQKFMPDDNGTPSDPSDDSVVFERAWGWDVVDTGPGDDTIPPEDQFEICAPVVGDVCKAGIEGTGEGQFGFTDDPIGVGPGGVVYVVDKDTISLGSDPSRVEKFKPSGELLEIISPLPVPRPGLGIAVDGSNGDFYIAFNDGPSGIHKYEADGSEYGAPYPLDPGLGKTALGIGSDERLYAAQGEGSFRPFGVYEQNGAGLARYAYGAATSPVQGIAPFGDSAGEACAFVNLGSAGIDYLCTAVPPGPVIPPGRLNAAPGNTKATLSGEVNPEGEASQFRFEYVEKAVCEKDVEELGAGHCFDQAESTPSAAVPGVGELELFRLQDVEAQIGCLEPSKALIEEGKCLLPETSYRYRLLVNNVDGEAEDDGTQAGEGEFTTLEPLQILATWSAGVGTDTAGLSAEVNPLGIPETTAHFEYVEDAAYEESGFATATRIPAEGQQQLLFEAGEGEPGEEPLVRGISLFPLLPDTTYHYRLVAIDPLIDDPIASEEHTLTTFAPPQVESCPNDGFRSGPASFLPDCRAYELVSPLEKNNGDILALPEASTALPAVVRRSSPSGEKLTYGSYRSFGEPEGNPFTSQYIARRDASAQEWVSHNIAPPRTTGVLRKSPGLQLDTEYKTFSEDLCQAWLRTLNEPKLEPEAVKGFPNIYRRTDQECGGAPNFEALTRVEFPDTDVEFSYPLELQGVSADGEYAIYVAPDNLTPDAPDNGEGTSGDPGDNLQLYIWGSEEEELRFLCVLPGGIGASEGCSAGTTVATNGDSRTASYAGALSRDGARIYWSAFAGIVGGQGKIYLRENPFGAGGECATASAPCSRPVSRAAEEEKGTSSSQYWAAAADGSAAIFSTGGSLFRYEAETQTTDELATAGVLGVMGASTDASYVYFASSAVLTGAEENSAGQSAQAGQPNLYLAQGGNVRFIATLSAIDANGLFGRVPFHARPSFRSSRVTPDGRHAVFTSTSSPTDYDNADAVNGEADAEVYLYDAEEMELVCASCNPSGSRPVGENLGDSINEYWAAAWIGVWQNALGDSRLLSDDGTRLYFEAIDRLVARDTNGVADVYQWEEVGRGGCDEDDSSFSEKAQGCVELISTGKSPRASEFIEADPSGENVFFATLASLLPQDYGLVDIYDAKVGGGLAGPEPVGVECEGEACLGPSASPQAPTPATATHGPSGNVPPPSSCGAQARKARRLSRRARHARRVARRAGTSRVARRSRRVATRRAKQAKRLSRRARLCRRRAAR
jgi:hypothetical protein